MGNSRVVIGRDLVEQVEVLRRQAVAELDPAVRFELGQFLTPASVAQLMASMFTPEGASLCLLDAGAGVGSLTAATVAHLMQQTRLPTRIEVVAYEIDPCLGEYLGRTLELCEEACAAVGVTLHARFELADFLTAAVDQALLRPSAHRFDRAILNPPYRKLGAQSRERELSQLLGFDPPNLYAAFVGAAARMLGEGGELVAITPRSFANGTYFRSFRRFLLDTVAIRRLHVFDSRDRVFREDGVLQENVIVHAERTKTSVDTVRITASETAEGAVRSKSVPWTMVVHPHDEQAFIHLIDTDRDEGVAAAIAQLTGRLDELDVTVSTGPVVDFRAGEFVRSVPTEDSVPLLYPAHVSRGIVEWPLERAKWNALVLTERSRRLTVPTGNYVLVKRFTAKEERRRVVALVCEGSRLRGDRIGIENHLNYFHRRGTGLPLELARGLATYLNSSLVDTYFRQFSGHTQVNASDLQHLRYPGRSVLERLGQRVEGEPLPQLEIDRLVSEEVLSYE